MKGIYQPYMDKIVDLDEWIKEIISWHFNPKTASTFWLKKRLNFDPIKDIKGYKDLEKFGFFNDEDLKNISMDEFVPKGFMYNKNQSIRVFETGGTLGPPKRIIDHSYRKEISSWFSYLLDLHGFPKKGNWLHFAPSGPHVVGYTTSNLAYLRKGLCHYIDIDTRWIKLCIKNNYAKILNEYLDHVLTQAIRILETQHIDFIFTTPQLLILLCEKVQIKEKYSIQGIVCGGTHITKDLNRILKEEAAPGIPLCFVYGNTIMGVAPQEPVPEKKTGWDINYYGFYPYFITKVVEPESPWKEVGYGETGRIMITVLTRDYFIPNLLERDEAMKIKGNGFFVWDGIANVKPYKLMESQIIEGVY